MPRGRSALIAALALLLLAPQLLSRMFLERQRFAPESRRPAALEVLTLKQLAGEISYEARRLMASVLYARLDAYLHEGTPVDLGDGRVGYGLANNLDVVPIYRLITILDPHFIEVYSLASTHLTGALARIDDAIAILKEGIAENLKSPEVSELQAQLGMTLIRDRNDHAAARPYLEAALINLRNPKFEKTEFHQYTAQIVNGTLIVACVKTGDLAAAARYARDLHTLSPANPALLVLQSRGLLPVLPPAPPAPIVSPGHVHVEGDTCCPGDAAAIQARAAAAKPAGAPIARERRLTDRHQRPWMEAAGLVELRRQLAAASAVALGCVALLVLLRLKRRMLFAAVLLIAVQGVARAGPPLEPLPIVPPPIISNNLVEIFLLFVVGVAAVLVMVLNHLVRRGRRMEVAGHDKLFGFVEEALKTNPSDEKHLEVGALSLENGLFDRALSYLARVTERKPALKLKAQYLELLALLGQGRLDEAASLQDRLVLDQLGSAEKYRLARAWKEHNLLSRAKGLFLRVFLTDIAFADVSQQLAEISSIEKREVSDSAAFLDGAISPRYRDLRVHGEGDREVVCLAFDRDLTRTVRLRVLRPERADDETVRAFLDEAVLLSRVRHPAVLQVYDVQKERLPYVSTEDFEGRPLAEFASDLPIGARLELATKIIAVVQDLVGEGKPLPCLPRTSLSVAPDGTVRVCRAPDAREDASAGLSATLTDVLPAGSIGDEFVDAGLTRVRAALASGVTAGPAGFASALASVTAELSALENFVKLTEADRERQGLLAHLRWLDDLHRSRVHGLKSKFAVCERYRDEPAKLMRAFFRPANLEEVCRMLASLEEKAGEAKRLPPCRHPAIPRLSRMLAEASFREHRPALAAIAAAGNTPDEATRATMASVAGELPRAFECFKDLSVAISRVVEEFELDLVRLIESVVASSTYAGQLKLDTVAGDCRMRVADTSAFRRELVLALENLISNSFEANASAVVIEIRRVEEETFRIVLRDDGPGIPEDLLERIRTTRFTSKEGGTSTGILSAKALVEKHRGRFDIHRRVGASGTEVSMVIPAA